MQYEWIKVKKNHNVAYLTLNRPKKRNALNIDMMQEINVALNQLSMDYNLRLLVINAEGDCFCAGADINWMHQATNFSFEQNVEDAMVLGKLLATLYSFPSPVLSLVQGSAFGGALGIVAVSDIVLCEPNSIFCLSEVKIGLIPALISPYLIEVIGIHQTKRYTLSAEKINATTALFLGLVHEVVEDSLTIRSEQIIENLLTNSPKAQKTAKIFLREIKDMPINDVLVKYTAKKIAETRITEQGREGTAAFLEKRTPDWIL